MKSKELMIGDWVLFGDRPLLIHTLRKGGAIELMDPEDHNMVFTSCSYIEDIIKPIPPTTEILRKNGWEYVSNRYDELDTIECLFLPGVGHAYFHSSETVEIDIIGYGIGHNGAGKFRGEVRSIHEIQHVLRLCGLNELADNFKVD